MKRVRIGVVGCGVIGKTHLRHAKSDPNIEICAVADMNELSARNAANEFGIQTVYESSEALIQDKDVEAVVFAVPTAGRTQMAINALRKGKHVLVEKPAGMDADEVAGMIEAKGELVGAACSCRFRLLPSAAIISKYIESGALGQLRSIQCRNIQAAAKAPEKLPPAWRLNKSINGGGILTNWGVYDIDYLLGITGWNLLPRLILAQTFGLPPQFQANVTPGSDAETHYTALIRCDDGTVINMERGEYVAAQSESSWKIIGTKGSLRLEMTAKENKCHYYDNSDTIQGVSSGILWQGSDDNEWYEAQGPINDFAEAILLNRPPCTTLEQSLTIQKIIDAVYRSATSGKAVELQL